MPDRNDELELALRELAATRAELQRSQEHLTLFAGQVSHDLRTPLTAILATAEMLGAEPGVSADEDLAWMVRGITRAAVRLDKMIDELLAYARVGGEPARDVTRIERVFDVALEDLTPVVVQKQAKVVVHELPDLPADPSQMYVVALNLLSNALKFSRPDCPPLVEVSAERIDGRWRVSVADNGIGVPREDQEAMFVLFARADKRVEGSGIGLAAARRVVEAHGGRIGMDASDSGGTTVWFELPA